MIILRCSLPKFVGSASGALMIILNVRLRGRCAASRPREQGPASLARLVTPIIIGTGVTTIFELSQD